MDSPNRKSPFMAGINVNIKTALRNMGIKISEETVRKILKGERSQTTPTGQLVMMKYREFAKVMNINLQKQ